MWREVVGYEGWYEVSDNGDIRSVDREISHIVRKNTGKEKTQTNKGKVLIQQINNTGKGYCYVVLYKNTERKKVFVHRVIAEAFIENPCNKKTVNHIDGNPRNNNLSNLEWATQKENIAHSIRTGLVNNRSPVVGIHKKTGLIVEYESIKDAAEFFGVTNGAIIIAINKRRKTGRNYASKGYLWDYQTEGVTTTESTIL